MAAIEHKDMDMLGQWLVHHDFDACFEEDERTPLSAEQLSLYGKFSPCFIISRLPLKSY